MNTQRLWIAMMCGVVACSAGVGAAAQDAPPEGTPETSPKALPQTPLDAGMEVVPYLGVAVAPVTPDVRARLALGEGVGLTVVDVAAGSPAQEAGLQRRDVIHQLDDQLLINQPQLGTLVRLRGTEARVTLRLYRDGEAKEAAVIIGAIRRPVRQPLRFAPRDNEADAANRAEDRWVAHDPDAVGGPRLIDGPEDDHAIDAARRRRIEAIVEQMRRQRGAGAPGPGANVTHAIRINDGTHTLDIRTTAGGKHLTVTDAAGERVFEGPINTEAQRDAVPAEVLAKVEKLERRASVGGRIDPQPAEPGQLGDAVEPGQKPETEPESDGHQLN